MYDCRLRFVRGLDCRGIDLKQLWLNLSFIFKCFDCICNWFALSNWSFLFLENWFLYWFLFELFDTLFQFQVMICTYLFLDFYLQWFNCRFYIHDWNCLDIYMRNFFFERNFFDDIFDLGFVQRFFLDFALR